MEILWQREVTREYGFEGIQAIVLSEKHGRLLVVDGYGGENQPKGGCVRFEHGGVYQLLEEDTFDVLDGNWNEFTSVLSAVLCGYDTQRPSLGWDGRFISSFAKQAGL